MRPSSWSLRMCKELGLDTSQFDFGGRADNVRNVGVHGWYQGKGVVNATPITYAAFFAALPDVLKGTEVTLAKSKRLMSLETALANTRRAFLACHGAGGRVFFIGNGGSAAISSHMAVDYTKNGGVRAMAFNDVPTLTCFGNDFGYDRVFSKQLEYYATARDLVVIISSSGRSLNIIEAANTARTMKLPLFTFTGMNPNNALRALGHMNYWVPSADYGIVELTHLTLLHAMVDMRSREERAAMWPVAKRRSRK